MSHHVSHLRLVGGAVRHETAPAPKGARGGRPLGQILLERGSVETGALLQAVALRATEDARIGEILVSHGWASEDEVIAALAEQWDARMVDLHRQPPDPRLVNAAPVHRCLSGGFIPWRRLAGGTVVVTARPAEFAAACAALPADMAPFLMAVASERDISDAIMAVRRTDLARRAETRVSQDLSCRGTDTRAVQVGALGLVAGLGAGLAIVPGAIVALVSLWSILTLALWTGLKVAAAVASRGFGGGERGQRTPLGRLNLVRSRSGPLPRVSMIVPLFQETDIMERLLRRLDRVDYPRELLEVVLAVEEEDHRTRGLLARTALPGWMRVVVVPDGPIRTKPRALNFALDFCRGEIVGVWDAEDAPAAGQLRDVVARFRETGPDVACLQGVLDFYTRERNWLSRCFAIEYAAWFRVVLPGLVRLGLVIPLGGTTLFFRREALERVGGWDAHNVTEDADLGVRLARRGYRAEVIATVTEEEPNASAVTWVRQRSRWLKGYAMTWAVHMRSPERLLTEVGPLRFLGMQVLFLCTLSQFTLAPVLWAYWVFALGSGAGGGVLLGTLGWLFLLSEAVSLSIALLGLKRAGHRNLMLWAPTLPAYFPLGTAAAAKALYEAVVRPFYWDKTAHGLVDGGEPETAPGGQEAAGASPVPIRRAPPPLVPRAVPRPRPNAARAERSLAITAPAIAGE